MKETNRIEAKSDRLIQVEDQTHFKGVNLETVEEFLKNFRGRSEYGCVINIFKIPELCVGGEEVWDESELGFIV